MTACNLCPPCAECAARGSVTAPPNALLGQASAVFEHVESERSEYPAGDPHNPCPGCGEDGKCLRDGCGRCCWCGYELGMPITLLATPSTSTDLLTMHLRAMCAVVRGLAGYLPYEQQLALWAAEEACRI